LRSEEQSGGPEEDNQMKIACQENLVPGESFREKIVNLEKYGFQGIELWGTKLGERIKEINTALSCSEIKVSTICAGYRGCLLDGDHSQRDLAFNDIRELLSLAGDLGAVGLIVVPIFGPPRLPDLSPWRKPVELEEELLLKLLEQIAPHAEKVKAALLLEPLNRYETHLYNRLDQVVDICKKVGSPYVKMMADFFHMNIEESNIGESIIRTGRYLANIHLADSNRLLPGYGHTDFLPGFKALKKIGYQGYLSLECGIPGKKEEELPKCVSYLKGIIGQT